MELKSPDEKLARETISETGVGESGNPISGLFYGRCEKRREGAVYFGIIVFPDPGRCAKTTKGRRECKGEHADCGSKAMLRVCNSTNKDDRYRCGRRNIRASVSGRKSRLKRRAKERWRINAIVRICMHIDRILKAIMLML